MKTFSLFSLAPFAVAVGLAAIPHAAFADGSVSPKGKGIVGGALLGAEVVTMPMGIAGLRPWWPYVVFGSVGAAGGAVGGWAIESQINKAPSTPPPAGTPAPVSGPPAEATVAMLAVGLALVIPTLVVDLNATTKHHDVNEPSATPTTEEQNKTPDTGPGAKPPDSTSVTVKTSDARKHLKKNVQTSELRPRRGGSGAIVGLNEGLLQLGLPAVEVSPMYSATEQSIYGVQQRTEVKIPVFSAAF
jgi:hypothetical protein